MTTITINGQQVEAARIDDLSQTILQSRNHLVPAMLDGQTVRLTVAQILSLLEMSDLPEELIVAIAGKLSRAGGTMTGLLTLAPSDDEADGTASLRIPAGADTPNVQADGDLWADGNENLRYRRGGADATVYDSVNLPRPAPGEMAAGIGTDPRALSAADVQDGVSALAIGVGQTWQDVLASRTLGTTYQNTTGRPIQVFIYVGASANTIQVSTDGSTWVTVSNGVGGQHGAFTYAIIPEGNYYQSVGGSGLARWAELR